MGAADTADASAAPSSGVGAGVYAGGARTALSVYGAIKTHDARQPEGTTGRQIGGAVGGLGASIAVGSTVVGATTAAAGAAAGALAGSVVPIVGTIIGAAIGFAIAGMGGGKTTQHGGRYSVNGHALMMKYWKKTKRWDDADAEIAAWFGAGQGSADERARFKPLQPLILPSGKANYSWVARYGHQAGWKPKGSVALAKATKQDVVRAAEIASGAIKASPDDAARGLTPTPIAPPWMIAVLALGALIFVAFLIF